MVSLPQEAKLSPVVPTNIETVYLGGGTPSLIPSCELEALVKNLGYDLSDVQEFTIEVNPATIDIEKLTVYHSLGINRISLGVQSLDDRGLKFLGRIHSSVDAIKSLKLIFNAGFENVSVDLIYGIPGQTLQSFEKTLTTLLEHFPLTHLSAYLLSYEPGTPLFKRLKEGQIERMSEQKEERLYNLLQDITSSYGLKQYEVSSFARSGYICKHNIKYWKGESYLGLGPSAHSFFARANLRWANVKDIKGYIRLISRGERPIEFEEKLGRREQLEEFIMLALRMVDGISCKLFETKFKRDINNLIPESLISRQFLKRENGNLKIPLNKMFVSDEIIGEIFKQL